jgi:hypothetical protein
MVGGKDMSTSTDISTLYREFTEALTEVLAENAVGPARRADWRERALRSKGTLNTARPGICKLSMPPSTTGKLYKSQAGDIDNLGKLALGITIRGHGEPNCLREQDIVRYPELSTQFRVGGGRPQRLEQRASS